MAKKDFLFINIEAERSRQCMTVEQLSNAIGISKRTYYTWQEKGNIPATKLIDMSRIFGCTIDYLLGISTKAS